MKYLIIGASAAGLSAARTIRELDSGGDITVLSGDGEIYSRCLLPEIVSGEAAVREISFIPEDFFKQYRIEWRGGVNVNGLLPEEKAVLASDGGKYQYDRLLIATGASSAFPPLENLNRCKGVFGLRSLEDALAINRAALNASQAVVLGGGLVGIEAAEALARKGLSVTVIEIAGHILPMQLDRKAAVRYEELIKEQGIEIVTGEPVSRVVPGDDDRVRAVVLQNGGEIPCGLLVVAAGVKPNVDFLKGIPMDIGRGIRVNERQETSLPDVYAAGDVCESYECFTEKAGLTPVWPSAVRQGQVAGSNMAGVLKKLEGHFAFMNSMSFCGLATVSFGLPNPPGDGYTVLVEEDRRNYKKFVIKEGRLVGAILQGDISGAGVIGSLIGNKINVSNRTKDIFDVTYADFFCQEQDGSFRYMSGSSLINLY